MRARVSPPPTRSFRQRTRSVRRGIPVGHGRTRFLGEPASPEGTQARSRNDAASGCNGCAPMVGITCTEGPERRCRAGAARCARPGHRGKRCRRGSDGHGEERPAVEGVRRRRREWPRSRMGALRSVRPRSAPIRGDPPAKPAGGPTCFAGAASGAGSSCQLVPCLRRRRMLRAWSPSPASSSLPSLNPSKCVELVIPRNATGISPRTKITFLQRFGTSPGALRYPFGR